MRHIRWRSFWSPVHLSALKTRLVWRHHLNSGWAVKHFFTGFLSLHRLHWKWYSFSAAILVNPRPMCFIPQSIKLCLDFLSLIERSDLCAWKVSIISMKYCFYIPNKDPTHWNEMLIIIRRIHFIYSHLSKHSMTPWKQLSNKSTA